MPQVRDLYAAVEADNIEKIGKLLTADPNLANSVEETPPPIHWAIYQDKRAAVQQLLEYGADTELRDQDRDATALDYAVVYGRKEIIRLLVSYGANLDGRAQLAAKGASGGFEEFNELPGRAQYQEVVELLEELEAAS